MNRAAEAASSLRTPVVAVLGPGYADYETERALIAPLGAGLLAVPAERDAAEALRGSEAIALLVRERPVGAAALEACPGLRLVVRYGVGVDNIDLDPARRRRVYVANVPDYGAENEVSDHAVALYLAVARRIVGRDREVRAGAWGIGQAQPIPGRRDATVGLIGFGRIARAACRKFRALGFARVLVSDPALAPFEAETLGVESAPVDEVCRAADLLSLHAPLTSETHHLIDERRLGLMKPTAVLVNAARGGLVDEAALARALRAGRLFGAGLDVFEVEPPGAENPLLTAPNTVLSDHGAWYSEASVRELQTRAGQEVARVLAGAEPLNWVNPW